MLRGLDDDGRLPGSGTPASSSGCPPSWSTALLGVEREGDGWVVVMEDVGAALLPDDRPISRAESRRLLAAAAAIHERFAGADLPPIGRVGVLYRFLSPAMAVAEAGSPNPLPGPRRSGLGALPGGRTADVADAIATIHADPFRFGARVRCRRRGPSSTATTASRTSACAPIASSSIDWGSSCALGPGAADFAWYLIVGATRIDATRDEVIDDFIALEGARHDPRALGLALIGALASSAGTRRWT